MPHLLTLWLLLLTLCPCFGRGVAGPGLLDAAFGLVGKSDAAAWDAENRLTGMETRADLPSAIPRQKLGFKYDCRSRRVQKVVETWNGTAWATTLDQRFVWDGWRLLQGKRQIAPT